MLTHNTLVLIVPRANPARIHSVTDLRKPDVKLVIAGPAVPVGAYTLQVLKTMRMTDVLDNVVSRESDVRDVLAKVALGEADAGFVYATDARTVPGKVTVLRLPVWARPNVAYGIAVVTASKHRAAAAGVREDAARQARAGDVPRVRVPAASHTGMRRVAFFAIVLAATLTTLAFLVLPVVAIFTHVSPVTLARQLSNPVVDDALVVSAKTTLVAQALVLLRRHAHRVPPRDAALPRPLARRDGNRAAARVAARRRGHRPARRVRPHGAAAHVDPVHADGGDARGRVRLRARCTCARRSLPSRPSTRRSSTPPGRSAPAPLAPSSASRLPLAARRPRRGRSARIRPRPRRVRRDDHVRRLAPAGHADAAACDLRRVRRELRRHARNQRRARAHQRRRAHRPQARNIVDALTADLRIPLRTFDARADARGRGHGRARRPFGSREEHRAARDRGPRAARSRDESPSATRSGSTSAPGAVPRSGRSE